MRSVPKAGEVWRHWKRRNVKIICIAREYDLGVDFVVHETLGSDPNDYGPAGQKYARSVDNFLGEREPGVMRFVLVAGDPNATARPISHDV
jgi:hypothetical protein